ncbi:MAG TPA: PIN domain-containing protein [Candidatus Acidoferrum sp.]|nr:PIN domain-containing protein [Candidatus Acidoferrum sp.]
MLAVFLLLCPALAGLDSKLAKAILEHVSRIVGPVDQTLYQGHENLARERTEPRDPRDWPVVAVALLLDIPVWTEDQDFFGSGVSTWTTDRVETYLRSCAEDQP